MSATSKTLLKQYLRCKARVMVDKRYYLSDMAGGKRNLDALEAVMKALQEQGISSAGIDREVNLS